MMSWFHLCITVTRIRSSSFNELREMFPWENAEILDEHKEIKEQENTKKEPRNNKHHNSNHDIHTPDTYSSGEISQPNNNQLVFGADTNTITQTIDGLTAKNEGQNGENVQFAYSYETIGPEGKITRNVKGGTAQEADKALRQMQRDFGVRGQNPIIFGILPNMFFGHPSQRFMD